MHGTYLVGEHVFTYGRVNFCKNVISFIMCVCVRVCVCGDGNKIFRDCAMVTSL